MRVSIVGAGYVGLVTGACLAEKAGHHVTCVDVDPEKVDRINRAVPPIFESGLAELLRKNVPSRLSATTDLEEALKSSDTTVIAVGTPFNGSSIDLSQIHDASIQIGKALRKKHDYHLLVVKSTVVPGTTDDYVRPILEETSGKRAGPDFGLAMNPEFLTEGQAVQDFMNPDRIVLGGIDHHSISMLDTLYECFPAKRIRTNNKTAEMIKYVSNCLLANLISFSNEIANLCSAVGDIDAMEVMAGLHSSAYFHTSQNGYSNKAPITAFLIPGCGYGGSCLPKDVKAMIAHGRNAGQPMRLLEAVDQINQEQPGKILEQLKRSFPVLDGISVSILGLSFRPDTADLRESPSIPLIEALLERKAKVKAYDPAAMDEARRLFRGKPVFFCDDLEQALTDTDAVVLVTRWNQFKVVPGVLQKLAKPPLFIDGRRMLEKHRIARYQGIGL
jgi:UDPglucose 6-dehydrogenase